MDRKTPAPLKPAAPKTVNPANTNSFRVAIIGENGSGKTSLMLRLTQNSCPENMGPTRGKSSGFLSTHYEGKRFRLEFDDFTKDYKAILGPTFHFGYPRELSKADVIIFVCDITDPSSLRGLENDFHPQQLYRQIRACVLNMAVADEIAYRNEKNLSAAEKNIIALAKIITNKTPFPTIEQVWEYIKTKKAEHDETKHKLIEIEIRKWQLDKQHAITMEKKAAALAAKTASSNQADSTFVPELLNLFDTNTLHTLVKPLLGDEEVKSTTANELPPFDYKKIGEIIEIVNQKHPPFPEIFSLLSLGHLRELKASHMQYKHDVIKILVATKCELLSERTYPVGEVITPAQLQEFSRANKFQHTCMVSAATGVNISELKLEILNRLITKFPLAPLVEEEPTPAASKPSAPAPNISPALSKTPAPALSKPSAPAAASKSSAPAASKASAPAASKASAPAASTPSAPVQSKPLAPTPATSKTSVPAPATSKASAPATSKPPTPASSPVLATNKPSGTVSAPELSKPLASVASKPSASAPVPELKPAAPVSALSKLSIPATPSTAQVNATTANLTPAPALPSTPSSTMTPIPVAATEPKLRGLPGNITRTVPSLKRPSRPANSDASPGLYKPAPTVTPPEPKAAATKQPAGTQLNKS